MSVGINIIGDEVTIVIGSDVADYHAAAICWALDKLAFPYLRWEGDGHEPERQVSLDFGPSSRMWIGGYEVKPEDVFWYRRLRRFSYHPNMATIDQHFVLLEARRFAENMGVALELTGCRCVNPPTAAWSINRKGAQLVVASQSGLSVPRTLMGNEPKRIGEWLRNGETPHIHKGFQPHVWENPTTGVQAFSETVQMPEYRDELAEQLSYVPGIYQDLVVKVYDVRVFVAGTLIRGFIVRSEMLDWRLDLKIGRAHVEEVEIPQTVMGGLRSFMLRSGLVSGSFDFAVDAAGVWWFLEVNETGQFLWIDHAVPSAGLFQDFLSFLTGLDADSFAPLSEFSFDHGTIPARPLEKSPLYTSEV